MLTFEECVAVLLAFENATPSVRDECALQHARERLYQIAVEAVARYRREVFGEDK